MGKEGEQPPGGIEKRKIGTGVTEVTVYELAPGPHTGETVRQWFRLRLMGMRDPIELATERATSTLRAHSLPFDSPIAYATKKPEQWRHVESVEEPSDNETGQTYTERYGDTCLQWELPDGSPETLAALDDYIIEVRGFGYDSPVGFAAMIVCAARNLSWAHQFADINKASDISYTLGSLICAERMKREWDLPATRGQGQVTNLNSGRRKGSETNRSRAENDKTAIKKLYRKMRSKQFWQQRSVRWRADQIQQEIKQHPGEYRRYSLKVIGELVNEVEAEYPKPR